jgi:protein SDA1
MEDEDDEAGWENWEVESNTGSESSGWQDVSSDGEDLEISDSEDEAPKQGWKNRPKKVAEKDEDEDEDMADGDDAKSVVSAAPSASTEVSQTTKKLSLLAQQKILTPADFALLNELRLKAAQDVAAAGGGSAAKRKLAALEASKRHVGQEELDRFLTESEILGPRKKVKADYEERMESIRKGREGREKFGSLKGKKMKENKSSSTNREKARNKPIMMALQ